jgi:hypothetical protein
MSRRVSLPGADELFRATVTSIGSSADDEADESAAASAGGSGRADGGRGVRRTATHQPGDPRTTGREKHDEKITVYVSPSELVELERARLALRADHGLAVDRGRIVREALSVVLADLEAKGGDSILVRRLLP